MSEHRIIEDARRHLQQEVNSNAQEREALEAEHGQCWDTDELQRDFEVVGFCAPFVVVKRKSDGAKGSLMFQHYPRLYFRFEPTDG
jgi:hypothetical protein